MGVPLVSSSLEVKRHHFDQKTLVLAYLDEKFEKFTKILILHKFLFAYSAYDKIQQCHLIAIIDLI